MWSYMNTVCTWLPSLDRCDHVINECHSYTGSMKLAWPLLPFFTITHNTYSSRGNCTLVPHGLYSAYFQWSAFCIILKNKQWLYTYNIYVHTAINICMKWTLYQWVCICFEGDQTWKLVWSSWLTDEPWVGVDIAILHAFRAWLLIEY